MEFVGRVRKQSTTKITVKKIVDLKIELNIFLKMFLNKTDTENHNVVRLVRFECMLALVIGILPGK